MATTTIADDLRAAAELLDSLPEELVSSGKMTVNFFPPDEQNEKEWIRRVAKAIGHCRKDSKGDSYLYLRKTFGVVDLDFNTHREKVCTRVQVGTQTIPAQPAREMPATPEREVPIYEWECPPVLKGD